MFYGKLGISILTLLLVACGGKYEAPHELINQDVGQQTTQPKEGVARIDCNAELTTVEGQIIRLSDTSSIFKLNESAGKDWNASSVVIPMESYSLLARYSTVSLKPEVKDPAFYVIICQGILNLDGQCPEEKIIKVNERIGYPGSFTSLNVNENLPFQFENHSVVKLKANCIFDLEFAP